MFGSTSWPRMKWCCLSRGGFSQVSPRHAEQDLSHQLLYIDSNNLFGFAVSRRLPISSFDWVESDSVDLLQVSIESDIGYITEVDIDVPDRLLDYFNEYPY